MVVASSVASGSVDTQARPAFGGHKTGENAKAAVMPASGVCVCVYTCVCVTDSSVSVCVCVSCTLGMGV